MLLAVADVVAEPVLVVDGSTSRRDVEVVETSSVVVLLDSSVEVEDIPSMLVLLDSSVEVELDASWEVVELASSVEVEVVDSGSPVVDEVDSMVVEAMVKFQSLQLTVQEMEIGLILLGVVKVTDSVTVSVTVVAPAVTVGSKTVVTLKPFK